MSAYVTAIHTWFADIGVEMDMLYQSGDSDVYFSWKHPTQWKGNDFGYVNTVPHIARALAMCGTVLTYPKSFPFHCVGCFQLKYTSESPL